MRKGELNLDLKLRRNQTASILLGMNMECRLEEEIGRLLKERGLTIAVAESATGGLISNLITNVSGSSDYFRGAVVSYDNEIKARILGVRGETLERYGAVSRQTGEEMAEGVRKLMNADIGLSDTGIAGPTGATPGKPVGLFYIGLSYQKVTRVEEHLFHGDRLENKRNAAEAALRMLREYLLTP
jgi:PncC family amidohydrolase